MIYFNSNILRKIIYLLCIWYKSYSYDIIYKDYTRTNNRNYHESSLFNNSIVMRPIITV